MKILMLLASVLIFTTGCSGQLKDLAKTDFSAYESEEENPYDQIPEYERDYDVWVSSETVAEELLEVEEEFEVSFINLSAWGIGEGEIACSQPEYALLARTFVGDDTIYFNGTIFCELDSTAISYLNNGSSANVDGKDYSDYGEFNFTLNELRFNNTTGLYEVNARFDHLTANETYRATECDGSIPTSSGIEILGLSQTLTATSQGLTSEGFPKHGNTCHPTFNLTIQFE